MSSKKIKAMIVDDERYSRDELKHLLSHYEEIDVIDEADSGESAVIKCLHQQPDVVFLDVEMPKLNGMETAKSLKQLKHVPLIVFATAYPDFAVEAFRFDAVDYLVKPFDEEQLNETVQRLLEKIAPPEGPISLERPVSKLAIESEEGIVYIQPEEILYLYRDERVTRIVGKDEEYEVKTPLKDLEARLKDFSFFRIHKSYLVNLNYVLRLIPWFNGAYHLELKGHKEKLSVSRNYVKALRTKLEL
ncbi:LytR/AlgR family response regulator transcription factor [Metabacillus herbersteinensis]|uniref:LytR/AlgR family response regulator transcription factor n=1 Tax=Metabacillus herbersteinensis TaxID=283816 RepID=A0ABV6GBB5_9BACI